MFSRTKPASPERSLTVTDHSPESCRRRLQITLAAAAIAPVREAVVKEFQKDATIAGFRKGKAPRELVERHHSEQIREELIRRLTRHSLEQAVEERRLKPVGPFEISQVTLDDKGLALDAQVEVEPEFALGGYRKIPLKRAPLFVSPEELQKALGQLQESAAQLVPTADGQSKERRIPALDDEFAKDVGFETLEKLKAHLEAKGREQKQALQRQQLEQSLCDALLSRQPFEVPAGLVARQTERLTRDFFVRLLMSGRSEDEAKKELEGYTEGLRTSAARHVKLSFILDRIAEQEKISVAQHELVDRLWTLARQWGKDPGQVRKLLDERGLWPSVLSSIRQDKTISWLMSQAHIEETTTSMPVSR